ncbi:hypothetical protein Tco_1282618 [Tanacetum coccineum]
MPYPRFTKVIINHFLSIHKSIPKALPSGLHTIKDDGILSRMKFVQIREDVQEYGKAIPKTMLTNAIKQAEAYKAFIDYSTGLVPPKKTRGTDVALELGKSISKTDVEIADETRRIHDTHARLVTEKGTSGEESKESDGELAHRATGRRRPRGKAMKSSKPAWKLPEHYNSLEVQVKELVLHQSDEEEKGDYDRSIDIEETNDERTYSDNGDQAMIDMEKNVAEKTEEEQGDEENAEEAQDDDNKDQKDQADDDIIGTLVYHSTSVLTSVRSQVPSVVNEYLGSTLGDTLQKVLQKHTKELIQKRRHEEKDEDPSAGLNQWKKKRKQGDKSESSKKSSTSKESSKGKTPPKTSKTGKYVHAEETVEEATHEVAMDVEEPTQENVENNVDQPQSKDAPKTSKIPN